MTAMGGGQTNSKGKGSPYTSPKYNIHWTIPTVLSIELAVQITSLTFQTREDTGKIPVSTDSLLCIQSHIYPKDLNSSA